MAMTRQEINQCEASQDTTERLKLIDAKLSEFERDISGPTGDVLRQFQSGYYVHHRHVRWMLEELKNAIAAAPPGSAEYWKFEWRHKSKLARELLGETLAFQNVIDIMTVELEGRNLCPDPITGERCKDSERLKQITERVLDICSDDGDKTDDMWRLRELVDSWVVSDGSTKGEPNEQD